MLQTEFMMAVKEKIGDAKYFLDKIKNATERKDFIPNLSAYLCSTRSILDYLLEDYNVKYGLKVTLDERLDKKIFEKVAMTRKNSNAMAFIKGYNSRLKKLKRDKIAELLLTKRNIKVHRKYLPLNKNVNVSIMENVNKRTTISKSATKWSFDDYKEADVVEVCKEFLRLMTNFVNDITSKYG
jgi:hypothetical protein